jgi:hypothetical protein
MEKKTISIHEVWAVVLAHPEGVSLEDIALKLKVSESRVRPRLSKLLRQRYAVLGGALGVSYLPNPDLDGGIVEPIRTVGRKKRT